MTNKEFFELYQGRRVRVLINSSEPDIEPFKAGDFGIVLKYSFNYDQYPIKLKLDQGNTIGFKYNELEVLDELKQDNKPLPLPG